MNEVGGFRRGDARRRAPRRAGALLLALSAAGACASRPAGTPEPTATSLSTLAVTNRDGRIRSYDLRHQAGVGQATVLGSPTAVWAVLPFVFEALEIEVTRVDALAAVMGNGGYRARRVEGERLSRFLDCGRGLVRPYADEYEVTMSVVVQLLSAPDDATTIRTVVDAYARDRSSSSGPVHCLSWGNLERRVAELVTERLDG